MDNNENNNDRIAVLKARIEDLHFIISTLQHRESYAIKWFSIVGLIISAIFVGMQGMTFYQVGQSSEKIEQRAQSILDRTEARLDELINNAIPDSAWVDNRYSDGSKAIIGSAWIQKNYNKKESDEFAIYRLNVEIPAKIFINGEVSAKLLGYEYRFTEDFPEILYSDFSRETREEYKRQKINYVYTNLGSNGVMISPKAGINFSISIHINQVDCHVVEQKYRKLVDARNIGAITIRPVLEKTSPKINVTEAEFSLRFVSNSLFDCKSLSNIE